MMAIADNTTFFDWSFDGIFFFLATTINSRKGFESDFGDGIHEFLAIVILE